MKSNKLMLDEFQVFITTLNTDDETYTLARKKSTIEESWNKQSSAAHYKLPIGNYEVRTIGGMQCIKFSLDFMYSEIFKSIADSALKQPLIKVIIANEKLLNYTYNYENLILDTSRMSIPIFRSIEDKRHVLVQYPSFIYVDKKILYTGEMTISHNEIRTSMFEINDDFNLNDIPFEIERWTRIINNYYRETYYQTIIDKTIDKMTESEKTLIQMSNI